MRAKIPAHRSTYKTQHKFSPKKQLHSNKIGRELCNSLIFFPAERDFDKLAFSQKLVFIFVVSTLISTAMAATQEPSVVELFTQKPIATSNQNAFFVPLCTNSTRLVSPNIEIPGTAKSSFLLGPSDMNNRLQINTVTTQLRECQKKSNGVSAGKVCLINNKKNLLKAYGNDIGVIDRYSNILLGIHNLYFVNKNIGIDIPNIRLIHEKDGQYISSDGQLVKAENYLASEFVEGFTSFRVISSQYTRMMRKSHHLRKIEINDVIIQAGIREKIVDQVGETGLAKLAVAGTFIQDLVMNEGNWGIANNELVIIDADHSPQSLEEYLLEAAKMPGNINMDFSIHTLEHMISIYDKMSHKMPILFHPQVDFTRDNYQFLIDQYLIACNNALNQIKTTHPNLPSNKPSKFVNDALSKAFRKQLLEYNQVKPESLEHVISNCV